MLEDVLMVYAALIGLTAGAFVGWVIFKTIKKKREEKLMYFDKDESTRFIFFAFLCIIYIISQNLFLIIY